MAFYTVNPALSFQFSPEDTAPRPSEFLKPSLLRTPSRSIHRRLHSIAWPLLAVSSDSVFALPDRKVFMVVSCHLIIYDVDVEANTETILPGFLHNFVSTARPIDAPAILLPVLVCGGMAADPAIQPAPSSSPPRLPHPSAAASRSHPRVWRRFREIVYMLGRRTMPELVLLLDGQVLINDRQRRAHGFSTQVSDVTENSSSG
ncbi:hypothetical protein V8D89_003953 [Ganoderma adspersum]